MRLVNAVKVLVMVGVAVLLVGVGGCSPGPVVWRVAGEDYVLGDRDTPMADPGKEVTP